jgi:hypothetical protein
MDKFTPRYKAQPSPEDLPKEVVKPQLKCCQIVDQKLVLPSDIRGQFLTCPVFGPEWRSLLETFASQWAAPLGESRQGPSPVKREGNIKTETSTSGAKEETKEETFDWSAHFPGDAVTYVDLKKKHGEEQLTELPGHLGGLLLVLAPGPSLYLVGKDAVALDVSSPLITHGPGTWLLGDKASKFMTNNPGKGFLCQWKDDQAPVCVEDCRLKRIKTNENIQHKKTPVFPAPRHSLLHFLCLYI